MKKVVVFGGGTGLSTLLRGLKQFPIDITAIVTVADDGSSFPELMAYELGEGRLENIHGRLFFCPEFSDFNQNEVLEFDRNFTPKKRLKLPGQLF